MTVPDAEAVDQRFGPGTQSAVAQLQSQVGLPATGSVDRTTQAVLSTAAAAVRNNQSSLKGRLVFDYGLPATGVKVRLYEKGFAGSDKRLAEVTTGPAGVFVLPHTPQSARSILDVRVVGPKGTEISVSAIGVEAATGRLLSLVVPGTVQPLAPEFNRLRDDLKSQVGTASLGQAEESDGRKDLTLLNRSTGWDARLVAMAALAAQNAPTTGVGEDILYALYRVGLPTDPEQLALVDRDMVGGALAKAASAGIVTLNKKQIAAATASFQTFATKAQAALTARGSVSSYGDQLQAVLGDKPRQAEAFASLYFSNTAAGSALWDKAAQLGIPNRTIEALKLQGKFLYLTSNNAQLTSALLTRVGSIDKLPQLVENDLYSGTTWKTTLASLARPNNDQGLQALIPSTYTGTTAERLEAYSADLARKVRISFPTHVVAHMIEKQELPVAKATAGPVSTFLKAAATSGYELGRTPLNAFLVNNSANLPPLDDASVRDLKTLHRLYQVTPSTESLQAAIKLEFTSALDIASYERSAFMEKFADAFPSRDEASIVYGKAKQIASTTFNFFSTAKQLDSTVPVYALSGSSADLQGAKDSIVQQFPTMASLFGSLDYCQCQDCHSVLSPAAYFVDLLEFLRTSAQNPTAPGYTPLDVLVGKDNKVKGRRPDLAALPLTCENTNTAMPYIDLVNEILEYFIANSALDANVAYDTGGATTADLVAEPQHILTKVYSDNLKSAVYPLDLPFDLWLDMVRCFLNYFNVSLKNVLEALRPADGLELFTDANTYPYYRAQILAESLGIGPAEYGVMTVVDPNTKTPSVQQWFLLYGYPDEPTALNGVPDATDPSLYAIPPLKSAKNLSQRLGLSYQELTDLLTTGFLNPSLTSIVFGLRRFDIEIADAFSYTSQPGYVAMAGQAKTDFEARLDAITQKYKKPNPASTFDAKTWLTNLLPANYSTKVLVLRDPDSGCNFEATTLEYADGSEATAQDFLKFNLFVRLWRTLKKLTPDGNGWTLDDIDRSLQLFFPSGLPAWTNGQFASAFSAAWKTALVYVAHLDELNDALSPMLGRASLLPLWSALPVQGVNPLYAQLFLAPGVLNGDMLFDDPAGLFPGAVTDTLEAHQAAMQGILGLSADDVAAIISDAAGAITTVNVVVSGQNVAVPSFTLTNLSICYRYASLSTCLQLSVPDLLALKEMSGLDPFRAPTGNSLAVLNDDVLFNQTLAFVKLVKAIQASGFLVEDVKFLLRHQFDPVGKYQSDPNALITLLQSMATGLKQIRMKNSVPADLAGQSSDLIEQKLSMLFPAQIIQALFALLTNRQTYRASQAGVAPANALDPVPFAQNSELSFSYDPTTQTQSVAYKGVLLDWQKTQLVQINNTALFAGLLTALQAQAHASFARSLADLLGVWASLAEYEAIQTGVVAGLVAAPLMEKDPALSLGYDSAQQLQRLTYRGVLTDAKKSALAAIDGSVVLAGLLADVQSQVLPTYRDMVGALLAMWANSQVYEASRAGVAPANQVDGSLFANVSAISFGYDPVAQVQTLTYTGVLTDADRISLGAVIPASAVLAGLLQTVRNQALQLFQGLAAGVLTVAAPDLDAFSQPYLLSSTAQKQKQAKAALCRAFLPLLERKLSSQFILQTLAASLGSAPALTNALLTDAALLTDPSHAGKSLFGSFRAVAEPGVSASYFASADQSGAELARGTAATADLADPTNPNANQAGTGSAHFEGYLQVLTDGPYRFFAELGDQNAQALLRVDSPDPAALLNNPLIQYSAATNNDESSQFAVLRGGVAYHFRLDFRQLGTRGARLLIQGENLSKGPLSQVVLYPQEAVTSFIRARTLLSKVTQILGTFGLTEREAGYIGANSAQFNNLNLSALPTQASDDSVPKAIALFAGFLALSAYADLRKGPAGGTGRLVDVFENVGQTFIEPLATQSSNDNEATPWTRLAYLTRRTPQAVRDVAKQLGLIQEQTVGPNRQVKAVGDFANHKGIWRMWDAIQVVQKIGVPVATLSASSIVASIAPPAGALAPEVAADNLKNAVKAQSTPDAWRPIAQSVFDKLRRKKRDALVSYLVNALALTNPEQLFEYFLVDPGMEPVVQTSRIRLALSSVQTFIQRCLLNLENGHLDHPELNVAPGAIDARLWKSIERFRVFQVLRKIYLRPENWMEFEMRPDKSDLYQDLESALLQGDVSRTLVEDAFFEYLQGLEERARLDVVASYLDQDLVHPQASTLHVVARTYGKPHKYFYRTYSNQTWSAWEVVSPDIEGDHLAVMVWRGRVNLFWLTFLNQGSGPAGSSTDSDSTQVGQMTFKDLSGRVFEATPQFQIQVQLHWSEYFQGKWSNPISTDIARAPSIGGLNPGFDPNREIYLHVSKEFDANGNEKAAKIHLDLQGYDEFRTFRVTSKNADPDFGEVYWESTPPTPYHTAGIDATGYTGAGLLEANFQTEIDSGGVGATTETELILNSVGGFELIVCANPLAPPFLNPQEPLYQEAGGLVGPFFYKDTSYPPNTQDELTFFVQPTLTETTISEWQGWAVGPVEKNWNVKDLIDKTKVIAQVPQIGPVPVNPGDPVYSIYKTKSLADWVTNPRAVLSFGGTWIGQRGGVKIQNAIGSVAAASASALGPRGLAGASGGARLTLIAAGGVRPAQALTDGTSPVAGSVAPLFGTTLMSRNQG